MNKKLIRKMLTAAGGPIRRTRILFTPEQIALFESQATRVPGMNNSEGNRYREEGVLALRHLEQEAKRKEEEIKSRMEMRPTLKKQVTTAEKIQGKKDEYELVPLVVGMSGTDPVGEFILAGIGFNGIGALAKTGLWNVAKYAPTTQLGNWGRGYFVGNAFRNSFSETVPTLTSQATSLLYLPVKLNETGLTSLKFFEKPTLSNAQELAGATKWERNFKPKWHVANYPGYLLKGLMKGSLLEKLISKNGTININLLNAYFNKASQLEREVASKVLSEKFAGQKTIDYNLFKKAVLDELITYERVPLTKYAKYGMDRLGLTNKVEGLFEEGPLVLAGIPQNVPLQEPLPGIKINTFTFESPKIPIGNNKHYDLTTLGHSRTYTLPEDPHTLYVMESLSDWALKSLGLTKAEKTAIQNIDEQLKTGTPTGFSTLEELQVQKQAILDRASQRALGISYLSLHLHDNYLQRQLQENLRYAAENGLTKMRYPTSETAAKIEGYLKVNHTLLNELSNKQMKLGELFENGEISWEEYDKMIDAINKLKKELFGKEYDPKHQTILKKYADFPKLFLKLFKDLKVRTVTDAKGNTWYEVDVPKGYLSREWQFKQGGKMNIIKLFKEGGKVRKMLTASGGPIELYNTLWVDNWRNRLTSPVVVAKQLEKLTSKIPIKYLGGSKDNARKEFWKQEPVLQHAVDSVASLYRINPESLKYRLDKEGFTDRLIQRRNDRIKIGALRFEPRGYELLNNPNYGLDGTQIGLDDAKTYIDSGKVKLINENWDERGPFKNEKGRMTYPVNPVTLNDGMGIVAAHLKYFRDEALLDFPNGSEYDLDRYANAYYNRGTYGGKKWVLAGAKGYNYRKKGGMLEFLKKGGQIRKMLTASGGPIDYKKWDNAKSTAYKIPFIPEKRIKLTNAGLATGAVLSTNLLDSIADNAVRAGLPILTAIGLAVKESTLGNPTDDKSEWNISSHKRNVFHNIYPGTVQHINEGEEIDPVSLINYYKGDIDYGWRSFPNEFGLEILLPVKNQSVLKTGFEFYKKHPNKYNPGQKNHLQLVEKRGRETMRSPEILKWYKEWEKSRALIFRPEPYKIDTNIQNTALKFIPHKKQGGKMNILEFLKNGSGIHIKKKNRGKFTSYCGGKVTDECILKGKNSSNPAIRKRATFAANARKWKHKEGGIIKAEDGTKFNWQSALTNMGTNLFNSYLQSRVQNNKINSEAEAAKAENEVDLNQYFWDIYLQELAKALLEEELKSKAISAMNDTVINSSPLVTLKIAYDKASKSYGNLKATLDARNKAIDEQAKAAKSSVITDAVSGVIQNGLGMLKDYYGSKNNNTSTSSSTTSNSYFDNYVNTKYKKFGTFNPDGSMNMLGGTFTIKDGYKPNQPQLFNYQPPKLNI